MKKDAIKFIAVGDLLMGEHPVTSGHGVDTVVKQKGADYPFTHVSHLLNKGDIVLGNLEGGISDKGRDSKDFISTCFRGSPQVAQALSRAGFTVLSLANNHTMQHGRVPLDDTIRLLDKNDIAHVGVNREDSSQTMPVFINKNGLKVVILGYCKTQQYNLGDVVLSRVDYDTVAADINRFRDAVDCVVLTLHWGNEFTDRPSPRQIQLGRKLIDAGADLIIGHHSHVLQGIERYNKGVIVYSLGSFVKDLWPENMRESIIFECELSKAGRIDCKFTPIFINSSYQPEIMSGSRGKIILERLSTLSEALEQEDLSCFKEKEIRYTAYVKELLEKDRRATYLYYIRNFFRYDPLALLRNFWLVIRRRVVRKTL